MNAISANDTGLPVGARERLALFAEWTKTTPPERILVDDGDGRTFSDDILIYADQNGMSLDWFWLGNEMGLVMEAFHRARETPVVTKCREYMAARELFIKAAEATDQDDQPAYDELVRIEDEMHALPSMTAQDMAIKMVIGHGFGDHSCLAYDGPEWAEARALVADIVPSQPAPGCRE